MDVNDSFKLRPLLSNGHKFAWQSKLVLTGDDKANLSSLSGIEPRSLKQEFTYLQLTL
jgi:hypothetical protein